MKLIFFFIRWSNINESERSGLAVLDVTIPTGYIIQQQRLDAYILSQRVRNLQRARFQERKVLFYFDYVSFYNYFYTVCGRNFNNFFFILVA